MLFTEAAAAFEELTLAGGKLEAQVLNALTPWLSAHV